MSGAPTIDTARAYTTLVICAGATLLVARLPEMRFDQPWLLAALLVGSTVISASKVHLPLVSGKATLSMSYFTDFLALILLGLHEGSK